MFRSVLCSAILRESPAVNENRYRHPQLDSLQRVRDLGTSAVNRLSPSNPSPRSSENPVEEETEMVRASSDGRCQGEKAF